MFCTLPVLINCGRSTARNFVDGAGCTGIRPRLARVKRNALVPLSSQAAWLHSVMPLNEVCQVIAGKNVNENPKPGVAVLKSKKIGLV